ncbi:hypothetical protein [Vulcanococcus limneticus]|uniref:hypothetical protein n=1 Tax=Vulcanococcus limneticus TaxID=2170428 RepID=UPI00398BC87C
MKGSIQRRLTVAINWSAARIASLDSRECYEDSYALTEEFREWILCVEEHPSLMAEHVLVVPSPEQLQALLELRQQGAGRDGDGLLEI